MNLLCAGSAAPVDHFLRFGSVASPPRAMLFTPAEPAVASFDGWTLVCPAVCIGSVGQLAVDLLLCTTGAQRCGFLSHPALLPVVGNDPLGDSPGASPSPQVACVASQKLDDMVLAYFYISYIVQLLVLLFLFA